MPEHPKRFQGKDGLVSAEAPLRHIDIDPRTSRDRFGNRIFQSSDLAYLNHEGELNRAALVVSEAGQRFLKENSGLLKFVDLALQSIGPRKKSFGEAAAIPQKAFASGGLSFSFLASGGQSHVYKVETSAGDYVIKAANPYGTIDQPYVHEMFQTQSLIAECGDDFRKLGIGFPEMLFATHAVLCTEYIPNPLTESKDFASIFYAAAATAEEYIDKQLLENNALWKNIAIDISHKSGRPPARNFRTRKDGQVIWVDPFIYIRDTIGHAPRVMLAQDLLYTLPILPVKDKIVAHRRALEKIQALRLAMHTNQDNEEAWERGIRAVAERHGIENNPNEDLAVTIKKAEQAIILECGVRWVDA